MRIALVSVSGVLQPKRFSFGALAIVERAKDLPGVETFLRRHWHNPCRLANTLAHEHDFDRIVMFGHSRGARFCCDCCGYLEDFDRPVSKLIFADGWDGSGELLVAANVIEVEAWVQSYERPKLQRVPHGSEIQLQSSATKFTLHEAPREAAHHQIDELPDVVACVLAACRA